MRSGEAGRAPQKGKASGAVRAPIGGSGCFAPRDPASTGDADFALGSFFGSGLKDDMVDCWMMWRGQDLPCAARGLLDEPLYFTRSPVGADGGLTGANPICWQETGAPVRTWTLSW